MELYEEVGLQARLAQLYREAEKLVPGDNIIHVDGDRELDQVAEAVENALAEYVDA